MNKLSSNLQRFNFLTYENGARIEKVTSEMRGCDISNILNKESKLIWLSEEGLPQEIIIDLSTLESRPKEINCIGIYCWHAYPTNPKLIEISISKDKKHFDILGNFDLCLKPGTQLFDIDPLSPDDVLYLKLIIKETFGGKKAYINNVFLYEAMPSDEDINNHNSMNESSFMMYLRESRERSLPRSTKNTNIVSSSKDLGDSLLDIKSKEEKFGTINSNTNLGGNITTTENQMLISDSELSERRFGEHYIPQVQITDGIIEEEEDKEKSSVYNSGKKNLTKSNRLHDNSMPIENGTLFNPKELFSNNTNKIDSNYFLLENNELNIKNKNLSNITPLSNYINTQNSGDENSVSEDHQQKIKEKYLKLENEFHSYQSFQDEKFKHVNTKLSHLENEVSSIKDQIDKIADNIQVLVEVQNSQSQRIYETVIEECKKMINNKLSNSINQGNQYNFDYNNSSYNESAHFIHKEEDDYTRQLRNQIMSNSQSNINENEYIKMNNFIDIKLEEKFSDFSSRLGKKIADTLLKPSFEKLENMMKGNLNEVKGALKNVEMKVKTNQNHKNYTNTPSNNYHKSGAI